MSADILGTSCDQCRSMVYVHGNQKARTAQDGHLDSHTAPELWDCSPGPFVFKAVRPQDPDRSSWRLFGPWLQPTDGSPTRLFTTWPLILPWGLLKAGPFASGPFRHQSVSDGTYLLLCVHHAVVRRKRRNKTKKRWRKREWCYIILQVKPVQLLKRPARVIPRPAQLYSHHLQYFS